MGMNLKAFIAGIIAAVFTVIILVFIVDPLFPGLNKNTILLHISTVFIWGLIYGFLFYLLIRLF
jgi:hypothetical protein